MLGSGVKRRVVNPFQKLVLNPLVKAAFELGIPPPGDALLETIGRRSGQARGQRPSATAWRATRPG